MVVVWGLSFLICSNSYPPQRWHTTRIKNSNIPLGILYCAIYITKLTYSYQVVGKSWYYMSLNYGTRPCSSGLANSHFALETCGSPVAVPALILGTFLSTLLTGAPVLKNKPLAPASPIAVLWYLLQLGGGGIASCCC